MIKQLLNMICIKFCYLAIDVYVFNSFVFVVHLINLDERHIIEY